MSAKARLGQLGVTLPQVAAPLAAYVPAVRTGNLVYTRPGLRFTVRSQRSADRCRGTGDAMAVAVSSGAPDSESCGPTSTWQG